MKLILFRYMFKEFVPNFLLGLVVITIIGLLNELFKIIELYIERNIPLLRVLELFMYTIPYTYAYSFPFGILMGALLAVGRFSEDSEVIAMRASGISANKIFFPLFVAGVLGVMLHLCFYEFVLPWGNSQYLITHYKIVQKDPTIALFGDQKYFVQDWQVEVGNVDHQTGEMKDVTIVYSRLMPDSKQNLQYIMKCSSGYFLSNEFTATLYPLKLLDCLEQPFIEDVEKQYRDAGKPNVPEYSFSERIFESALINLPFKPPTDIIAHGAKSQSITENISRVMIDDIRQAKTMLSNIQSVFLQDYENKKMVSEGKVLNLDSFFSNREKMIANITENKVVRFNVFELHHKLAVPFNCLVLILVGAPLGVFSPRRGGRAIGIILGIVVYITWYALMFTFQWLFSRKQLVSAEIGAWAPTLVLMAIGFVIYAIRLRR